jgi:bifunctional enzyme CysN/CysC
MKKIHKVASLNEIEFNQSEQHSIRIFTCGSLGVGKSTLIGYLISEFKGGIDDHLNELKETPTRRYYQGHNIESFFVDCFASERKQSINIDLSYYFFSTTSRKFISSDTPGYELHTNNMLSGACRADLAVLVIDACQGVVKQTLHHAYLVSLLGIKNIVLAVNKMDLVLYDQVAFNIILTEFQIWSNSLGLDSVNFIPISALTGDNILEHSLQTSWYQGPTLMDFIENTNYLTPTTSEVVFFVHWINNHDESFIGFSGTLSSGKLSVGDVIRVTSSGQTAKIIRIVTTEGDIEKIHTSYSVTLVLDREVVISPNEIFSLSAHPLDVTDQFEATLIWMNEKNGYIGRTYELKLANQLVSASITEIKYKVNVNSLKNEPCAFLSLDDIVVANLSLSKPLVFSPNCKNSSLGRLVLFDNINNILGFGIINHNLRRAQNVYKQALSILREDRERLNGHRGKVVWFTGLSGSGKSTIANVLEKELYYQGKRTYILDGDNIRQGLCNDLGFTNPDRVENIRRVAEVAKLMMDAGLIVLTAFISPFREERKFARELIGSYNFIEVFVDTPLNICEQRDPKGLYKKARSGLIPNMTGINSKYEEPLSADYTITYNMTNLQQALNDLINLINKS